MPVTMHSQMLPGYEFSGTRLPALDVGETPIARTDLFFIGGGSDKVYIVFYTKVQSGYRLFTCWGRRGASVQSKVTDYITDVACEVAYNAAITNKTKEGYQRVGGDMAKSIIDPAVTKGPRIIFPMNANPVKPEKLEELFGNPDWVIEEKYDGVRLTMHILPGGNRLFSRNAGTDDASQPLEKTLNLPLLAQLKFPAELHGTILDCEGLMAGKTAAEISGDLNSSNPTRCKDLYLMVFDIIQYGATDLVDLEWKYRRQMLTKLFTQTVPELSTNEYPIKLSPYSIIDKEAFHVNIIARGGEGTMLKNINAVYKPGGRPQNTWYKVKRQDTWDCIITGYTEGQGKYAGQIGAVQFGLYFPADQFPKNLEKILHRPHVQAIWQEGQDTEGRCFQLATIGQTSGMSDAIRAEISANRTAYLGRVIEVEAREMIKKTHALMHPRFIRFREDKDAKACICEES